MNRATQPNGTILTSKVSSSLCSLVTRSWIDWPPCLFELLAGVAWDLTPGEALHQALPEIEASFPLAEGTAAIDGKRQESDAAQAVRHACDNRHWFAISLFELGLHFPVGLAPSWQPLEELGDRDAVLHFKGVRVPLLGVEGPLFDAAEPFGIPGRVSFGG